MRGDGAHAQASSVFGWTPNQNQIQTYESIKLHHTFTNPTNQTITLSIYECVPLRTDTYFNFICHVANKLVEVNNVPISPITVWWAGQTTSSNNKYAWQGDAPNKNNNLPALFTPNMRGCKPLMSPLFGQYYTIRQTRNITVPPGKTRRFLYDNYINRNFTHQWLNSKNTTFFKQIRPTR